MLACWKPRPSATALRLCQRGNTKTSWQSENCTAGQILQVRHVSYENCLCTFTVRAAFQFVLRKVRTNTCRCRSNTAVQTAQRKASANPRAALVATPPPHKQDNTTTTMQQYHVKKHARSSAVPSSANRRLPSPVRVMKVTVPPAVSSVVTSPVLSRSAVFATSNEAFNTPINHYLPSQVRTTNRNMPQLVSSVASPALIASPMGRPSIFAASNGAFRTPVFSTPCTSVGVGEKPMDMFTSGLSESSPTSVASPLSKPNSVGGISSGEPRTIGGNLDATKLTYDYGHRSPPSRGEMVFEPIDRSSPRSKMNVLCSPCSNNDTTREDTGGKKPPPTLQTFQPFTKSRSGSINNSSYQKKRGDRVSTNATSPTSPTPQNLKDNPERLAKVKTEMCRYFELGGIKNCPWGDNCKSSTSC